MIILTQFINEKRWVATSTQDALKIIQDEMPQTDAKATLDYIISQIQNGKTITFGECRFKIQEG
jgi:hypothetical protein